MSKKLIISKRIMEDAGVIKKVPLRSVTVSDTFIGINPKTGKPNMSDFMELASDLERGQLGLTIDVISV